MHKIISNNYKLNKSAHKGGWPTKNYSMLENKTLYVVYMCCIVQVYIDRLSRYQKISPLIGCHGGNLRAQTASPMRTH